MKKLNFIDFAIIFVIIAVLVLGWLFFNKSPASADSSKFSYDILLKEIPIETVESIQKNADLFDGVKIINIGTIEDYSSKPSEYYEYSEEKGEYVYTSVPEMYNVTITVSAVGKMSGLSHYVNDYEINVGKSVDIKSVGFVGHGVIVAVHDKEK